MRAKPKLCYIVYTLLILCNLLYLHSNNTSALSYQSPVNVGFTFNPTLSIGLSSSDLVIPNLTPGTTESSNAIDINVSTNNVYGYNLYATVGNEEYNNTDLTNISSNSNNSYTFSNISTNANLPNLDTDNTWGYSYSLDNGSSWSNYSGLPFYTTETPTRLIKNTGPSEDTINFKIGAKAGNTQPSGIYSNVINFIAITKPSLITLADAYAAEGKELYHGYYKMQDMTPTICKEVEDIGAQLQVIDIRDDKVYWIAKLADDNCWMTQNLDLDIDEAKTYTHNDTDLGWTMLDENATWQPAEGHSTIDFTGNAVDGWVDSNIEPYSANRTDGTGAGHNSLGNYYNWPATVATNDAGTFSTFGVDANNSICSNGWRLPRTHLTNDFYALATAYGVSSNNALEMLNSPMFFVLAGQVSGGLIKESGTGYYWTGTTHHGILSQQFRINDLAVGNGNLRQIGMSVRCLAR